MNNKNLSLLTDFYEITMANGYLENHLSQQIAYFDMFFRTIPDGGGFAIMAGLEQLIAYIKNLQFSVEDIEYLREKKIFSEKFLTYLKNFKFSCDIWAIPEGTPIFPYEPIVTVVGPIIEAQLIETMVLLSINHQSLIATKASRIVRAAKGRHVIEFGTRRAHGVDAAIFGARSAYIGGCIGTSCALAAKEFNIPLYGTMAHSWIQTFPCEYEAFLAYARTYPNNCTFLVDTYDVLKSGIPNVIKVANNELLPKGFRPRGIRIDSGDIAYLSKACRKLLDNAGLSDCKILASNSLDEVLIKDFVTQEHAIDIFGVGERLITSKSSPVFDGVYKLVAIQNDHSSPIIPKIKVSENIAKITTPGFKETWRIYDKQSNKALADVISFFDEEIDRYTTYEIFDPIHTWKKKTLSNFRAEKLKIKIFSKGECVYNSPPIEDIRDRCKYQISLFWEEILRQENPHNYYVDLSARLWDLKKSLIETIQTNL
ncbi:MAG: nicotinate phosphoribosyltransferase [Oligoflexia bacterium]|nr:nicotinate phosphoribosyltransferase [Oligoflexia bacterium]MBF0364730.1 nicotinate phosphoribosyltransferase [Oligoflexia bacterium]